MEYQKTQQRSLESYASEIRAIEKEIESFQVALNSSWNAPEMTRVNSAINHLLRDIDSISKDIDRLSKNF